MRHIKIIKELLNLNRHHVSPDMDVAIQKLCEVYGGNVDQHYEDPSLTWKIPPGYKVMKAELKDSKGKLICSHENNPMHLWPYSPSFSGTVSYSELKKRILVDFKRPEAIVFHFRNQYRFWKADWGFSLNVKQFSMLDQDDKFSVDIKTEFYSSPIRQFVTNKPKGNKNLILVAHLDHFCQLNDGLGSAILNNEVALDLDGKLENLNLCSLNSVEIVGSVYFLKGNNLNSSNTIAAISTNGLTLEGNLIFQLSGKKDCQINKIIKLFHLVYQKKSTLEQFREGWGNDEIAFEAPGVSIPCVSVHRGPHPNYHTQLDDFSKFSEKSFLESKNLIKNIVTNLDQNYHVEIKNWNGLICLSNPDIDLYIEPLNISGITQESKIKDLWFLNNLPYDEIEYLKINSQKVVNFTNKFQSFLSHNEFLTIVDIAFEFSLPVTFIKRYFEKLEQEGFVSLVYKD
tara:strand:+ start:2723 stop:4090 length:1368 start_codon:yes stop_codon:yes gene_type:complete